MHYLLLDLQVGTIFIFQSLGVKLF